VKLPGWRAKVGRPPRRFPNSSRRCNVSDMLPIEEDVTSEQTAVTKRLLASLGTRFVCWGF
jgi:hypothetical protein